MDELIHFDQQLLLTLNGSDSTWLDDVFLLITKTGTWLPMLAVLIWLLLRNRPWRDALLILLGVGLVILIADRFSSGFCKPFFHRFRPSHEPLLEGLVDLVDDRRGGLYGFISSHAANTFGVATFLALALRRSIPHPSLLIPPPGPARTCSLDTSRTGRSTLVEPLTLTLFSWACLSSYSRIYLGLHYPGDILCGALFGVLTGFACWLLYRHLSQAVSRRYTPSSPVPSALPIRSFDLYFFVATFWLTILFILLSTAL